MSYCSKLASVPIVFIASLQLSSYIYNVAAIILKVLLLAAEESDNHSFIWSIAISFVEGSFK